MGCGSSSNVGDQAAAQAAQQQQAITQGQGEIAQAFSGFTPAFYAGVGTAYQNQALPQLQQQYQQASTGLGAKLADQGLGQSSVAQQGFGALGTAMQQGQSQIGAEALTQEQQLEQQVQSQQNALNQQLLSSTVPQDMSVAALNAASSIQAPSTFAPIGNLLGNFSQQYLGATNASTYNQYAGNYLNPYINSSVGLGSLPQF